MKQDQQVTLLHHDKYCRGYLNVNEDGYWEFVTRGRDGCITMTVPLNDLEYSWKMRLQENTFEIGWQDGLARRVHGFGRHVSTAGLSTMQAPSNLTKALRSRDRDIWNEAYNKEYDGLSDL